MLYLAGIISEKIISYIIERKHMKIRKHLLCAMGIALTLNLISGAALAAEKDTEFVTEAESFVSSEPETSTEDATEALSEDMTESWTETITESETAVELSTETMAEPETELSTETMTEAETVVEVETETATEAEHHLADSDSNSVTYHAGDMAILQKIIENSAKLSERYGSSIPTSGLVTWTYISDDDIYRISKLDFVAENIIDYTGGLDVSGLDSLLTLDCSCNPYLNEIKLPANLINLNLAYTDVSVLDVFGCSQLESINCMDTPLASLDVSKNYSLNTLCIGGTVSLNTSSGTLQINIASPDMGTVYLSNYNIDTTTNTVTVNLEAKSNSDYIIKWEGLPEAYAEYADAPQISNLPISGGLNITAYFCHPDDRNNDGYHDGDVAVIQQIISQSPTLSANYSLEDFSSWEEFMNWTQVYVDEETDIQRVEVLNFETVNVTDISGVLDVSGLSYLINLLCQDNPGITEILLPQGTKLDYLMADNTGITSLDVSGCTGLTDLYCMNTGLTSLDLTNNPLLELLYIHETMITCLDLSGNPYISVDSDSSTPFTTLITTKGTFSVTTSGNGFAFIDVYDAKDNTLIFGISPDDGYYLSKLNGLPENAQKITTHGTPLPIYSFPLTGDVMVYAEILPIENRTEAGSGTAADAEGEASSSASADTTAVAPETGDESRIGWYMTLMAVSMMVLLMAGRKMKRS